MAKHLASKREKQLTNMESVKRQHGRRRAWRNLVRVLACTVVFCTTYALILPAITMESVAETPHIHDEFCYEAVTQPGEKVLICQDSQHAHVDGCYETKLVKVDADKLTCTNTDQEHTHTDRCYGQWKLNCPMLWPVSDISHLISTLPTADEVEEKLLQYQESGDVEGEAKYYTEISKASATAYYYYSKLSTWQKEQVTNADRLLALQHLWRQSLSEQGETNNGTNTVETAQTSDFITINLYDYGSKINDLYDQYDFKYQYTATDSDGNPYTVTETTSSFPGFQWNGGANILSTSSFNRHLVDHIDFGNSVITDFVYGSSKVTNSPNGVSVNANSINRTNIWNKLGFSVVNAAHSSGNRPAGVSLYPQSQGNILSALENAAKIYHTVKPILSSAGYPASMGNFYGIANSIIDGAAVQEPSFYPLFAQNEDDNVVKKLNTGSVDGLFQINPTTGAYYYNSRENHAQYNPSTNSFDVYEQTITPNFLLYPFGNFLPFNDITQPDTSVSLGSLTQGELKNYIGANLITGLTNKVDKIPENSSEKQLLAMLGKYRSSLIEDENAKTGDWYTWSAEDAVQDFFEGSQGPGKLEGDALSALQAAMNKMYNIDYDEPKNFFFGMDMSMTITMPKDGLTGNDNGANYIYENGEKVVNNNWGTNNSGDFVLSGSPDGISDYPMVFNFAGDDDVWVYIDGLLFLDLTGMHRHVGGRIDFKEGMVYYFALDPATGDVTGEAYQSYKFADIVLSAYQYKYRNDNLTPQELQAKVDAVINPATGTFYDYTSHEFKFFYMERGSGSSVCRMNFNFPILQDKSIEVTKELEADGALNGNPDFYFNILKSDSSQLFVGPASYTGVISYKIKDANGNFIMDGDQPKVFYFADDPVYGKYGIFTLKAGQTAVFEGILESSGEYYVQELIKNDDNEQFLSVTVNKVDSLQDHGVVVWSTRSWYADLQEKDANGNPIIKEHETGKEYGPGGYVWLYYSSKNFNASDPHTFLFTNKVDEENLTTFTLNKVFPLGKPGDPNKVFKFKITLDGAPLPESARNQLSGDGQLLIEDGNSYILLKAGQSVTLSRILSNSVLTLQEVDNQGYKVTYTKPNDTHMWPAVYDVVTGVYTATLRTANAATITATNTPAQVNIPVWKYVTNPGSGSEVFTFMLQRVTGDTFTVIEGLEPQYLTISGITDENGAGNSFSLAYTIEEVFAGLGEDVNTVTLYYKLTESPGSHYVAQGNVYYILGVQVTRSASGIAAKLVSAQRVEGEESPTSISVTDGMLESDNVLSFTNTLVTDLSIGKELKGEEAPDKYFRFELVLKPPVGMYQTQAQLVFSVTCHHLEGTKADVLPLEYDAQTQSWKGAFKMRGGEVMVIHGIPCGTQWTLTEDATGTFYEASNDQWTKNEDFNYLTQITVTGTDATVTDRTAQGQLATAGAEVSVTYTNRATYVLPETGGMGTEPVTLLGAALTLFSVLWLLYKRKRRREEPVSP